MCFNGDFENLVQLLVNIGCIHKLGRQVTTAGTFDNSRLILQVLLMSSKQYQVGLSKNTISLFTMS